MIDPEAIVEQVWQHIVPADWKIMRGKRRSPFAIGVTTAIWTGIGIILLAILAVVLNDVISAAQSGGDLPIFNDVVALLLARLAGYPALAVLGVAAVALALLVGLIVWVSLARRYAGDPDPVIVLLPNGLVEFVSQRQPIIGIDYAELAAVDFGRRSSRRARRNLPNAQRQQPRQNTIWLDLRYHDGSQDRWQPRADFGPPARIYQTIIKAHSLYHILYEGGY